MQLHWLSWIGIALIFAANGLYYVMAHDANKASPPDRRLPFWGGRSLFSVQVRHAELFPASRARLVMWLLAGSGFVCFLLGVLRRLPPYGH